MTRRLFTSPLTRLSADPLSKITNIFCGEVEKKDAKPQRQVMKDESEETTTRPTSTTKTTASTSAASSIQQRLIDSLEQGEAFLLSLNEIFRTFSLSSDDRVDCSDIRRSIEQSSEYGYIAWPLIKPLLLGKILYAPATPVSNAIIAKVNKTFAELDKIHQFAQMWVNSPLNLSVMIDNLQQTKNIKVRRRVCSPPSVSFRSTTNFCRKS